MHTETIDTEVLFELAREQRQLSLTLYSRGAIADGHFPSGQDPIRAEIARLCADFYARVGSGEELEVVFAEQVKAARHAAHIYSERQQAIFGGKKDWRVGCAGFYGEDEAEMKVRHARRMALACFDRGWDDEA